MMNREEWLHAMVGRLRPDFAAIGYQLPIAIRVSCGWPSRGGTAANQRTIGQAWSPKCSADGSCETFLSPVLSDPIEVGAVLVHELVHHAVGTEAGHKGPFRKCALAIGLEGKMRSTTAGAKLRERLHALAESVGPYPHASLNAAATAKKQGTRMLKVACQECECIVRMTRQWLDDAGAPTCACGGTMAESGKVAP